VTTTGTVDDTSSAAGDAASGTDQSGATSGDGNDGGGQTPDYAAEVEKWKGLARKHENRAKENADAAKKLQALEDSQKSDLEKAQSSQAMAEQRATKAESQVLRYEVAQEKKIPAKLMRFLTGNTREEIEAAADELLEATAPDTGEGSGDGSGKPKEKLHGGASDTDAGSEQSIDEVIKNVPR